jgi:hypothetical protein
MDGWMIYTWILAAAAAIATADAPVEAVDVAVGAFSDYDCGFGWGCAILNLLIQTAAAVFANVPHHCHL